MIHLSTYNTSYGRKKSRKSKCQFDFRPLKIKNYVELRACKWLATYHWKVLEKGYKFFLDLSLIRGLHKKLCASKGTKVLIMRILRILIWESQEKWHLGVTSMDNHKKYYKKEGGGFPLGPNCGESCEIVYAHELSVHQKCSNYALTNLLFGLCKSIWITDPLIILLGPHHRAPTCLSYPEVLRTRELISIHFSSIIFICRFTFEAFKEFGGALHPHYRKG
jgi:hypothetical protein